MHLLAARPGGFADEEGITDLKQSPGAIVILSSQDSSLGLLAGCADHLPADYPDLRLANLAHLVKPAAYDLYEARVLEYASLIIVSVLGGEGYWRYGLDRLAELAERRDIPLVVVPGDDSPDPLLCKRCRCEPDIALNIWRYLREGGTDNTRAFFEYLVCCFFTEACNAGQPAPPVALPPTLLIDADGNATTLEQWQAAQSSARATLLLLFYRSHVQTANVAAFNRFLSILGERGNVLGLAVTSIKDPHCLGVVNHLLDAIDCDVVINTMSFAQHIDGNAALASTPQQPESPFARSIPVIQAIAAGNSREDWWESAQGLRARDIAMNVALPEFDGRIIGRAVSFKEITERIERVETDIIRYELHVERARFVADLAFNWAALRRLKQSEKRIAIVLANYPARDGRLGNGVGLDTPASALNILSALKEAGYSTGDLPEDADALLQTLIKRTTNDLDLLPVKRLDIVLAATAYNTCFARLPADLQSAVQQRWGGVHKDPKYANGGIRISGLMFGNIYVGIQPARGYNMDLAANYHDPDLPPPHSYLAFYFWMRSVFGAHAVIHVGKHGNLEWLPGKSVGLSGECSPDACLGPLPHLYPFIVNDPGEGAQAKRRAQAVILDHLMPPMARAESHGELLALEHLVDEYYQALGLDVRREKHIRSEILTCLENSKIATEIGVDSEGFYSHTEQALQRVDTYLCELKEAQMRNGLHRFGEEVDLSTQAETIVALLRLPRGESAGDQGLLHALAADFALRNAGRVFDPLDFVAARAWSGNKPVQLNHLTAAPWRTEADARERLELFAEKLVGSVLAGKTVDPKLSHTQRTIDHLTKSIIPALRASTRLEIDNLLHALDGGFVAAGPSGAPTRGRLDVLPTGRNFYSVDARAIPTPSAWVLGRQSAEELIARHLQDHGDYPGSLGISVWGTSTMRTGGDDIAQAFALMGVRPVWAAASNRVTDIEIIPGFQLAHPRVDVTLRISGFFRDAFPNVVRLFDSAVKALIDYAEPGNTNTIRQHAQREYEILRSNGLAEGEAKMAAAFRVFGSKPGSYGAGLQGLIDEGIWEDASDLAKAYVNWGGYTYATGNFGRAAFQAFERRLSGIEAVVQNQDNREHDLLDSDDYYQFQGGMANAIKVLSGKYPEVYHGDHANPARAKIRTLKEELNLVIRSRVTNPKWIRAMQQHGYKGAFEMAASVDYVFAYDATTSLVDDYQYAMVADSLVLDEKNRAFLAAKNPRALKDMAERLIEAQQRGLWSEPGDYAAMLSEVVVDMDNRLETSLA